MQPLSSPMTTATTTTTTEEELEPAVVHLVYPEMLTMRIMMAPAVVHLVYPGMLMMMFMVTRAAVPSSASIESIFEQKKYADPDGKRKAVDACLIRLQMAKEDE